MDDPIAFFLTWPTYGTWLPGDSRGWVKRLQGHQLPDPIKEIEAAARMSEDACRLNAEQRKAVEDQIIETCEHRLWIPHAVNCRSNHVHVVLTAPNTHPKKIRTDLKAWTTKRLKREFDKQRSKWWAERGSVRYVFDEDEFIATVLYVKDFQDHEQVPPPGAF